MVLWQLPVLNVAWPEREFLVGSDSVSYLKGTVSREKFAKLDSGLCGDQCFIFLRCPFNLLRIIKDGAHRSQKEFMLDQRSGVNFASDTGIPVPQQRLLQPAFAVRKMTYRTSESKTFGS